MTSTLVQVDDFCVTMVVKSNGSQQEATLGKPAMETDMGRSLNSAAYGGEGWRPRSRLHLEELGIHWAACGQDSEWGTLKSVLLHAPGEEIVPKGDFNAALQLDPLDLAKAQDEHKQLAAAYHKAGVEVHLVNPVGNVTPNQIFCADLLFMTSEGAIIARPASEQRAGEERHVASRLSQIGIPILKTLTGRAVFEGADAMWLDPRTVVIARGLRTNQPGIEQIASALEALGVDVITVDLPVGTMHLMGVFRIIDKDLAVCWPHRTPFALVSHLRDRGFKVLFLPDELELERGAAMNFVTLGPRKLLMVGECKGSSSYYEKHDVTCLTSPCAELSKAAGAVGCLTGVLHRERIS